MSDTIDRGARIALARRGLADKLGELQRRGARLRAALSPSSYLPSPWLRIGISIGVGYLIGRNRGAPSSKRVERGAARSSIFQTLLRSTVLAVAELAVRRVLTELEPKPPRSPGEPGTS